MRIWRSRAFKLSSKVLWRIDNLDEGIDMAGGDIESIKDSRDSGMLPNGIVRIIIGAESGPQSRFNENADRPVNLRLFPEYYLRNVRIIRGRSE